MHVVRSGADQTCSTKGQTMTSESIEPDDQSTDAFEPEAPSHLDPDEEEIAHLDLDEEAVVDEEGSLPPEVTSP